MKKLLYITLLLAFAGCAFAQTGSKALMPKIGYETDYKRFGIGVEGRYFITDNIRLAPDAIVFIPKNKLAGLDINVNAHYVFSIEEPMSLYPLAGVAMINNRIDSRSNTDFGLNIGFGSQYEFDAKSFVNAEFKYTFSDWDFASFFIGYGIKF